MRARIVCLPGDGIGPEVMQEAVRVLTSVACAFDHSFTFVEEKLGRSALQAHGTPLGDKALDACRTADAVLLGACGSLRQDTSFGGTRPESGLRLLQQGLSLHTGIMHCANPSAPQTGGVDISLVWPLAGGTGAASADEDGQHASDTVSLTPLGAEQAARLAFRLARQRRRHVCAAFLADLDATARLFRDSSLHVSREYQDVTVKWLEADRRSLELIKSP